MRFAKIVVYGAGALGSYLAAKLAVPPLLVGREAHVRAIQSSGLRVGGQEEANVPLEADTSCPDLPSGALVFVTVKVDDLVTVAADLKDRVREDTVIAVLSNGLDPERIVAEHLGRPVVRVISQFGATYVGPGEITVWGGSIMLGRGEIEDRIASLLEASGLTVKRTDDLERHAWQKLAVNCVANPLSALTGRCNRDLITPELESLRHGVADEVRRLAAASGVELPEDLGARIDRALGGSFNRTSMLQDLDRGRPTEIEHLNGFVARRSEELGLSARLCRWLAEMVRLRTHAQTH